MVVKELYLSRERRDERYAELKAAGVACRRSTSRNQQLHPMYVKDYEGEEKQDTGFGNTVYRTFFARLYAVEV